MAIPAYASVDLQSVSKIINSPDPTGAQDVATKAYVDSAVEGLNWKDSVRAASTANVTVSGPGTTIDGVTLSNGDRILLKNQTTASENGIYIFNGSAVAATRSLDMNTAAEVEQAVTLVEEGTVNAGTNWRQTAVNVTLGSTSLTWTAFIASSAAASETTAGIAEIATQAETNTGTDDARMVSPLKLKNCTFVVQMFTATFGDGSTTSYDITHGLAASKVLDVNIYETGGTFREVLCEVQHLSTTQVRVLASPAPATNALTIVVMAPKA